MRNWIVLSLSLLFATNLQAQLLERQLHRQLVLNRNITSGGGGGGDLYSDNFDSYADASSLGGQGSWLAGSGTTYTVVKPASDGSILLTSGGGQEPLLYNQSVNANQYAELTLQLGSDDEGAIGPAVRVGDLASGGDGYTVEWEANSNTVYLTKISNGTGTDLASAGSKNYATGTRLRIEVTGTGASTRLTAYEDTAIDGDDDWVAIAGMSSIDPASTYFDTGGIGIFGYQTGAGSANDLTGDDFSGGNL